MPKLLVFAPCEKVIISRDDNNPTLIGILTQLRTAIPARELERVGTDGDERPMAPFRWAIFAMWQRLEGETDDRLFRQRIEILAPEAHGATVLLESETTFSFSAGSRTHRLTANIPGFPLAQAGDYTLRLLLDGEEYGTYPFLFNVATAPSVQPEDR
jgi:hypothetical protein